MLIEEQVSELLSKCERLLGKKLPKIRGDLWKVENRAAAIWELLVLEAAANVCPIEYEPLEGSSPDIRLHLPYGRPIWIEVTYLYPRFWKQERRSSDVRRLLFADIRRKGIPYSKILIRLYSEQTKAGRLPKLPTHSEEKDFLNHPNLKRFYDHISSNPNDDFGCDLSPYTILVSYHSGAKAPHAGYGSLVLESATIFSEHAVYRKLREKAKQFHIREPLVICLGSDQSPALSEVSGRAHIHNAVREAFAKHQSLSAVFVISIALKAAIFEVLSRKAHADLIINPYARFPLRDEEIYLLRTIDFNRWKFTNPIEKIESNIERGRYATGPLRMREKGMGIELEIPVNIVIDALAGKKSLPDAYRLPKNHQISRVLNDGWVIESCSLKEGNLEDGETSKIVLELVPPPFALFHQRKRQSDNDS